MAEGDGVITPRPEEPRICEIGGKGLWFPLGGDMEQAWSPELRMWIYGVALVYSFLGVAIIADIFLAAIEMITSAKRRVINPATGRYMTILLWNDTVANLTLLALGSSAPEILLSVVELLKKGCFSGQLGPATIVGSAAFNLLVIIAVCIVAIPSAEVRFIKETPVFYITGFFSIIAYVWLLVIVKFHSPEIVDIWEAVVTLSMFPLLVLFSYLADRGLFSRKVTRPHIEAILDGEELWDNKATNATVDSSVAPQVCFHKQVSSGTPRSNGPNGPSHNMDLSRMSLDHVSKPDANSEVVTKSNCVPTVRACMSCKSQDDGHAQPAVGRSQSLSEAAHRRGSLESHKHRNKHGARLSITSGRSGVSNRSAASGKSFQSSGTAISTSHYSELAQAHCVYPADPSRGALHPKRWIASHRAGQLTGSKRHMPHFEANYGSEHGNRMSTSSQSRRESAASVRHSFRHSSLNNSVRPSVQSNRVSTARSAMGSVRQSVASGCDVIRATSHPALAFRGNSSFNNESLQRLAVDRLSCELATIQHSHCSLVREEDSMLPSSMSRQLNSALNSANVGSHYGMHGVLPASSSSQTAPPPPGANAADYTQNDQGAGEALQDPLPAGDNGDLITDFELNPVICGQGVLTFCNDMLDVKAGADEREVVIPVLRRNGASGTVCCRYRTECFTALPGYDYREVEGELEFPPGVTRREIRLSVLPKRLWERNDRFQLILEDGEGGVVFNPNDDGGWDRSVLTITIVNESRTQLTGLRAAALKLGERMVDPDGCRLSLAMWKEQVKEAVFCNGSYEEQASASAADWMLHIMVFPWKILYALFVPPPVCLGGWICFVLALCHIALLTAVVCDLAELFGCVAGVDDSVTAITFVALGTSLPDLFASRAAARADEYADASIVNVTGSNCVNVFLGIGLPWTVAAIYWKVKGATDKWKSSYPEQAALQPRGAFVVKNDGLAFNVIVFAVTAVICLSLIRMRRLAFGGELGGPFGAKVFSGTLLVVLWAMYIFLSIWRSRRKDASANEIIGVVLLSIAVIVCLAIVFGVLLVLVPQNCGWLLGHRGGVNSVVVTTPEPGAPCSSGVAGAPGTTSTPVILAAPPTPNGVPPVLNGAPLSMLPHPPLDDDDLWGIEDGLPGPPDAAKLLKVLHGCKVHQAWLQQEAAKTLDVITAIEQVIRGDPGRGIIATERTALTSTAGDDEVVLQKRPKSPPSHVSAAGSTSVDGSSQSPQCLTVNHKGSIRNHPVCWENHVTKENKENTDALLTAFETCDSVASVGQITAIEQCSDMLTDEMKSRPVVEQQFAPVHSFPSPSARTTETMVRQSELPHDLIGMVQQEESHATVPGSLPSPPSLQDMRRPIAPVCQSYSSGLQGSDSLQPIPIGLEPIPIGSSEHAVRPPAPGKQGWCSGNM